MQAAGVSGVLTPKDRLSSKRIFALMQQGEQDDKPYSASNQNCLTQ